MTEQFDKELRGKFSGYTPDVPPHIWDNIMARKSKRRAFFWIWLEKNRLSVLFILLLIGTGFYLSQNQLAIKINRLTEGSASKKINVTPLSEKKKGSNQNQSTTAFTKPEGNIENTAQAAATIFIKNNNKPVIGKNDFTYRKENNKQKSPLIDLSSTPLERAKAKNHKSKILITNSSTSIFSEASSKATKKTRKKKSSQKETSIEGETLVASIDPSPDQNEWYLNKLNQPFSFLSKSDFPLYNPIPKNQKFDVPCPENNAAGNKKYVELYAGPDFVFRAFRDTANSAYLEKRKETTSLTFAFSAGMRYTRVFNNAISLRTGINYSQIIEKFKLEEGNIIRVIYITNSNGDTIGNYNSIGTRYRNSYNKYHTIDIPLTMGYEWGNRNFHTALHAGIIANIYSWQKGSVIDTAYKEINITTGSLSSPYQFKTNIGVGFIASASLYYKINDKMHILAEPYFRYNLSSVNKEEITLRQKFNTAGLRLGIRYNLK